MDLAPLISRIDQRVPGAVLERQRFGRTAVPCLWIEGRKFKEVARLLREDREAGFSWLENIGGAQIGDAVVLSYFVRSVRSRDEIVLRVALETGSPGKVVVSESVVDLWPMAEPMEKELGELFGVDFGQGIPKQLVTAELTSFPLRKEAEWLKS